VRRRLAKVGYGLSKGRSRNDGGYYSVVDVPTNCIVFGSGPVGYDATLDEVERLLTS
jgi:hypothetical protein